MEKSLSYVKSALKTIAKKEIEITEELKLADDIGLTSLDMIVFICGMENEFGYKVDVSDVMKWKTVKDAAVWLDGKITEGN